MAYPERLLAFLETLALFDDRAERIQAFESLADRLAPVPQSVAQEPYPDDHRAPNCESEAYVWATKLDDGGIKLWFAVKNPQGVTAKAMAAILDETLSGLPAHEIASVPDDLVYGVFGHELSMGKTLGLMGMVQMMRHVATSGV